MIEGVKKRGYIQSAAIRRYQRSKEMKKLILALLMMLALPVMADDYVNGYTRSDGTYVEGYYRSSPDGQKWNNYSSEGNTNPYNGKEGTKSNDYWTPPTDPYKQKTYK